MGNKTVKKDGKVFSKFRWSLILVFLIANILVVFSYILALVNILNNPELR